MRREGSERSLLSLNHLTIKSVRASNRLTGVIDEDIERILRGYSISYVCIPSFFGCGIEFLCVELIFSAPQLEGLSEM